MHNRRGEMHQQQSKSPVHLAIALGAMLGTTTRFLIGQAIPPLGPGAFPLGTLVVNLTGCLLLGLAQTLLRTRRLPYAHLLQAGITVGLLGGFTTFSTFSVETIRLLQTGQFIYALAYQALSLVGGVVAVVVGGKLGGQVVHGWLGGADQ